MSYDLSDPVVQAITAARVKLLFSKPFFGNLATRLDLVDASDWCKSVATDGRRLYYNRDFIKSLSLPELLFVLGHEVLHCVLDHLGRRGHRDKAIWGMAIDYSVNYILINEKVGTPPSANHLYEKSYTDEISAYEIYDNLQQNNAPIKMSMDEHLEFDAGDDESDEKKDGGGDGQGDIKVNVIGKDGPPKLSERDLQNIRNEVRAATIQAAQGAGAGNVPAAIRMMIDELTEPKLDWRTMLDAHFRSSIKDDFTFQRISRRAQAASSAPDLSKSVGGIDPGQPLERRQYVLPGQSYMDTVDIACVIDTSGSMSEQMLRDILSEIKGIMETFRDFRLLVWTFDTQTYGLKEFTGANLDEIDEYPMQGRGGTMFECNWEFMKREGIEPERMVFFTDGYPCGHWCPPGDENYCDVLWVIHGHAAEQGIEAPFGITAYYDEKKK